MTARRFKPYPAYKDSGVEWLGEIPAGWDVKRLKRVFRVVNGSTPASGEPTFWGGDISWVTPEDLGDLRSSTIAATRRKITEDGYRSCGTTIVPAGSLVLSTRAPIGHLALAGVDLCTNQGCRSLVFWNAASREFFYYELLSARPELEALGQGSTFRELAKGMLEDVGLGVPPEPEQRAIAAFLNRETARIDALVAKKERLNELLQEKRTALITRAVTKGLDLNVPMKDSGVEWLGEIPAHWELKKLRHALSARPRNGISPPIGPVGDVPTFSTAAVSDGEVLIDENVKYTMLEQREAQPYIVAIGDIFLLRGSGSRNIVGRAGILKKRPPIGCIYPDILIRVQPSRLVTPWFLVNSLNSAAVRFQIESLAQTASGIWKISGEDVRTLAIAVPPYDEQLQIQGEVSRHTARLDALTVKIRDAIDRLKELRTALISAAVTGKIDVREEMA